MIDKINELFGLEGIPRAEGFDKAVIGIDQISSRLIYSVTKCLQILGEDEQMTETEAIEYFEFNMSGAYLGEHTPIWCYDDFI